MSRRNFFRREQSGLLCITDGGGTLPRQEGKPPVLIGKGRSAACVAVVIDAAAGSVL